VVADDITHYDAVEAYCDQLSYSPGESVALHVRCVTEQYDVTVLRWGGQVMWQSQALPGVAHHTPDNADSHGCRWPVAVTVAIGDDWPSGVYFVTLRAHGADERRAVGYAMFVVRAASSRASALLVLATNTYNAYNTWGGRSLYTGGHRVSFDRPFGRGMIVRRETERDDRKARPAYTGEEPDADGHIYQRYRNDLGYPAYIGSAGWFTYERRFVEWLYAAGFEVDIAVSSDLHRDPSIADGYRLLLGVGHDEYWSAAQRTTVEQHVAGGGNFASFSGNTMFWQVRLEDDDRAMVCHKYAAHLADPVMGTAAESTMTGMWCDPVVGHPEWRLLGGGSAFGLYSRFGQATPRGAGAFTVYRNDHWLFAGTNLRYGDLLGRDHGVVGYETLGCRITFDDYQLPIALVDDGLTRPEVVAFTPASNLGVGEYPASISALNDQGDLEFIAERRYGRVDEDSLARVRHGNAVMLTHRPFPEGGEVVTIGTTDWVFGLSDPAVAQVTRNVLERMG
jgi:hypothetical protein